MKLVEVSDKKTKQYFHKVPKILYKNDPHWVCKLEGDIESIFDPKSNVFFIHGDAIRWVLFDDSGNLIGRVAAFINEKKAFNYQQPTGGMGFFECINDKKAAFTLFDACTEWLKQRGIEAMDGPINFGENDNHWGLLVEGFTMPGYGMNYNPPYYVDFFESYGFKFYFEQVCNNLDLKKPFPERFWRIAEYIRRKNEYSCQHFRFAQEEKFLADFKKVYDDAWAFHENFTPINTDDLRRSLSKAKQFVEEEFIWFVYHNNEPIAFLVMYPDFNQALQYFNGKLNFFDKLRLYYLVKVKKVINRARIVIMGVVPKHQRSGVESLIFWHMDKVMEKKPHYKELELSWVGDFNPKMRALHESVGSVFDKRYITYRKIFSEHQEHQRSTIIPVDTKEKAIKSKETSEENAG